MMRRFAALVSVMAAGVLSAVPASAETAEPTECAYTLSAPYVVEVAGTKMVTATMQPAACPSAVTTVLQACLSIPGKVGRCDNSNGITTAQVYLSPYIPGLNYTARGRGCAATTTPPTSFCTSVGPTSAVL
ncbi:hypothetical protein BVC93_26725 [Mycobacterium sp. MS1601]|uniref:hypothetical protein n=1 Tax=Mycobacterium sp. MS1601 TaxID=1936029 RepID=UPI0009796E23|nr:hypothetical protein [Mycobacterium sp. MS1601]AQA05386.1 hypothetical protein BVC93_26725 [Mycobacterium sp. MS1601]